MVMLGNCAHFAYTGMHVHTYNVMYIRIWPCIVIFVLNISF